MTKLWAGTSAGKTPFPTRCRSSLGTTIAVGPFCLTSGFSPPHTAHQSKRLRWTAGQPNEPPSAWCWLLCRYSGRISIFVIAWQEECLTLFSHRSNVELRLGEHDIWEPEGTEQHIMSAEFIRHPNYNPRSLDNDIMLIKLSQPAKLNSYVHPATLPSECATEGTMCKISGWGSLRPSDEGCELETESLSPNGFHCHDTHSQVWPTYTVFVHFQQGTLQSYSVWTPHCWVTTPASIHTLSKSLTTWSVLDIWREKRTLVR